MSDGSLSSTRVTSVLHQARALLAYGRAEDAVAAVCWALDHESSSEARQLFVHCIAAAKWVPELPSLRRHVLAAITDNLGAPYETFPAAIALVKAAPACAAVMERLRARPRQHLRLDELEAIACDELLRAMMDRAQIFDADIERMLTAARSLLLGDAVGGALHDDRIVAFACALARYCHINEYVFFAEDDEVSLACGLRARLAAAIEARHEPTPLLISVVAAYHPLRCVPAIDRLPAGKWPRHLRELIELQVSAVAAVARVARSISQLTPINDEVSLTVQRQYEANPYPRWTTPPPRHIAAPFDAFLRARLPNAQFRPLGKAKNVDVLVAGCGTGQHPVAVSRMIKGARVLAIDLTIASLAYARFMTDRLGVANVKYAQADILELHRLERKFDVVDATGVLHHLADPIAGLRILLARLRPGGFMRLGLYSARGRADVDAAREFVKRLGVVHDADGIRRARQALIALDEAEPARQVVRLFDFHTTSGCRDLLFHVQERSFTIPEIKTMVATAAVQFVGFEVTAALSAAYRQAFPNSPMTDLDNWDALESQHPTAFIGMYHFWLQKPAG